MKCEQCGNLMQHLSLVENEKGVMEEYFCRNCASSARVEWKWGLGNLKPCPFCGSKKLAFKYDISDNIFNVTICCDFQRGGCGACAGYRQSEKEARRAWNEREIK